MVCTVGPRDFDKTRWWRTLEAVARLVVDAGAVHVGGDMPTVGRAVDAAGAAGEGERVLNVRFFTILVSAHRWYKDEIFNYSLSTHNSH